MLTTSLPLLPPPATSLLPPLHDRPIFEGSAPADGQHSLQAQQQRRTRGHPHNVHPRSQLALLAYDERLINQRKLAIQMYGCSWLKPAGCAKTMLGQREEDLEREEVERQLREVELQERNQVDLEEAQRQAQLAQQAAREARGETIGPDQGEQDLDADVPDMDAAGEFEDEGSEDDEEEEEDDDDDGDEVDLDGDIPEADHSWVYDTTRDPDTESDSENEQQYPSTRPQNPTQTQVNERNGLMHAVNLHRTGQEDTSVMLSEDGGYGQDHDLDDDIPQMHEQGSQDLDDEIPDADQDDPGWEHTDSDLDESDMDISIMPPGATAHMIPLAPPTRQYARRSITHEPSEPGSQMRRLSGNIPLPMAPPARPINPAGGARRGLSQSQRVPPHQTPDQTGSDFSVSALISTDNTGMSSDMGAQNQRGWLDPASARRNLFGVNPRTTQAVSAQPSSEIETVSSAVQRQNEGPRQVSSGGLFTPPNDMQRVQQGNSSNEEPPSRTRSGRVVARGRTARGM